LRIRNVSVDDIPVWITLSKEYDNYVKEVVSDLTEWYEGNGTSSLSFDDYMKSKINKNEAFMAVDEYEKCCGIIAISQKTNNITFFGVFHEYDVLAAGAFLLQHAFSKLDTNKSILLNELKSNAEQIQKIYALLAKFNFVYKEDVLENGVPVNCMERSPDK
jgi:hypothetical protein